MLNKTANLNTTNNARIKYVKKNSIFLYIGFISINLYYFINNFFTIFFNKNSNGDEYYQNNVYSILNATSEEIFYAPSQVYIFVSSCLDYFINSPRDSTRIVSLISCLFLILFFVKRIFSQEIILLEKIYKSTLFVCTVFITNQMFMGTSDFLAFVIIIPAFLIIIENFKSKKKDLSLKRCALVGVLFGLSVATRPTSLVLILSFYITFLIVIGIKSLFSKGNMVILITSLVVLFLVNFLPIIEQNKIILDVKEIPKETGVNWFQRNYLMAKYWDSNVIPNTQWVSTQEVINFKKSNPGFVFPKNQIDLLVKETGLYFRQMVRMFIKALYSSYRYMYLIFPLLFLSFLKTKNHKIIKEVNSFGMDSLFQNKFIIIFYLISILMFSFLAVKLFEFRWVIPISILYSFFALNYLSRFPTKIRFYIYNISFLSGIIMYIIFFIKIY